jgi:hypothetical protein
MKRLSARNKIIVVLVGLIIVESIQSQTFKNDVTRLKNMNHKQIYEKYGITPKYPNKCYKAKEKDMLSTCRNDELNNLESNIGGIVGQYPIFMDRLFLTGDWIAPGGSTSPQFGKFENQSGEYDCAFLQDDKSNNYIIFQLVDGHYIDRPTVEALLNLTDQVSTFDLPSSTFTFKSNLISRFDTFFRLIQN